MPTFTWEVTNDEFKEFKAAEVAKEYKKEFTMLNATWNLDCFPKGETKEAEDHATIYLHCKTLPDATDKMTVNYSIYFNDNAHEIHESGIFTADKKLGCIKTIKFENMESLKIKCIVEETMKMDDIKNNEVTWDVHGDLLSIFQQSTDNKHNIHSPAFTLHDVEWKLHCKPNAKDKTVIYLQSTSAKELTVFYQLKCDDINYTSNIKAMGLNKQQKSDEYTFCDSSKLKEINNLKIKVTIDTTRKNKTETKDNSLIWYVQPNKLETKQIDFKMHNIDWMLQIMDENKLNLKPKQLQPTVYSIEIQRKMECKDIELSDESTVIFYDNNNNEEKSDHKPVGIPEKFKNEIEVAFKCTINPPKLLSLNDKIKQLHQQKNSQNSEINTLNQQITLKNETITKHETDIATQKTKISEFEKQVVSLQQRLNKYELVKTYCINPIIVDKQVDSEATKKKYKIINFEIYANLFKDHQNTINEWNNTTNKLENITEHIKSASIIDITNDKNGSGAKDDEKKQEETKDDKDGDNDGDEDDKKKEKNDNTETDDKSDDSAKDICFGTKLYDKYIEFCSMMDEQQKRLLQATNDKYYMQLLQNKDTLTDQKKQNEITSKSNTEAYQKCDEQYNSTQQQRISLHKIVETKVNELNETIINENNLHFELKMKNDLTEKLMQQHEELVNSLKTCTDLIHSYIAFQQNNENYINALKQYFIKTWSQFESKWWQWNISDIVAWFKYKTYDRNTKKINWDDILKELKKRDIRGENLQQFNETTLDMIGIKNFSTMTFIMSQITMLRNRYIINMSISDGDSNNPNTGNNSSSIPSHFICPITTKIMSDPVIAFDGKVYERSAIQKRYQQQSQNNQDNKPSSSHASVLFSHLKLKQEILSYKAATQIEGDQETQNID